MKRKLVAILMLCASSTSHAKEIEIYGFVKAAATGATRAVESSGRNNYVAYTAAANPVLSTRPDKGSMSMQVQQSRFGLKGHIDDSTYGLVEFDFVDFNQSTPTTSSHIRLRRGLINYKANENWIFNVGQDWDLFSPYAPYSYNLIGHYFLSGDTGFMRLQAQALYKTSGGESGIALGFPNYNSQSSIGNSEWTATPTLALRHTLYVDHWTFGASGIIGHLENAATQKNITPFAINIFSSFKDEHNELIFEGYYGHNLENLSLQALSYSPSFQTLKEWGAYSTYRHKYETWGWFAGLGIAKILNPGNLTASYSYVSGKATSNLLSSSTGYGIIENLTARLGYEYYITKSLNFYTEIAHLYTQHLLDPIDSGVAAKRTAQVFEVGLKLDM
ncbi:MAG: hypothetical protein H6623_04825 [Bdellovibrionaceae bacterium]|nr:hypothetical protein [Pseudobdellovibrionaceae bacterium]